MGVLVLILIIHNILQIKDKTSDPELKEKIQKIKNKKKKIIKKGVDTKIFKPQNKEKILEQVVARQLSDVDEILNSQEKTTKSPYKIIYQKLYLSAMKKNNAFMAIKAIKRLLPYTENKDVWLSTLVDLEVQVGNFKEAQNNDIKG